MNRIKISITDDRGRSICKIGSSIPNPHGLEYTDDELASAIHEMGKLLQSQAKPEDSDV